MNLGSKVRKPKAIVEVHYTNIVLPNLISSNLNFPAEYFLFCEMLLQRPIDMQELSLSNILSREETTYMREMAIHRFGSIMEVLKSMPRPMLLVFRNINTVRSINITLGAPVDRYFVMAKRLEYHKMMSLWAIKRYYFLLMRINHAAFQRGARLGKDPGPESRDPAQDLGLQLGEDHMGDSEV